MTIPAIPPDTAAAGQTGHIVAHNQISDVLTAIAALVQGVPAMSWGKATLVNGTVSVSLSAVDADSVVLVSRMAPSGTLGRLSVPSITPGTGFTVTSDSSGENSVVGYLVLG